MKRSSTEKTACEKRTDGVSDPDAGRSCCEPGKIIKGWYLKDHSYRRQVLDQDKYNVLLEETELLMGQNDLIHSKHASGYFILDGCITFGGRKYSRDTLLWFTGGSHAEVYLERHVHALYIESMTPLHETFEMQIFAADEMDWTCSS